MENLLIGNRLCVKKVLSNSSLGVDFTFTWDNNDNDNNNDNDKNNPHLNFLKGTVQEDKETGLGIKDKGQGIRHKG